MKKISYFMVNIGVILLAFTIYSLLQTIYLLPKKISPIGLQVTGGLLIVLTVIVVWLMWLVYRQQLKFQNPAEFDQKPHLKIKKIAWAILGFIVLMALQFSFASLMGNNQPANQTEVNQIITDSNWVFNIMVSLIAPIVEEIIFRGYLINLLLQTNSIGNKLFAIVSSGLVFGLLHEPHFSVNLTIYWGMGIILASVYVLTKDLRYSILVHVLNNSLSLL